jgi:hypothetical protein
MVDGPPNTDQVADPLDAKEKSMFQGHAGLSMDGDHLDISYNTPEAWPWLTPSGSIRAFIFHVGDLEAGPCFQLGLIRPVADETLDWRHSIDPLHHHGSDQFRAIVTHSWNLAGRRLDTGDYAFQEAGTIYQEHPGPRGAASTMLIMADRRGNQATIALRKDAETVFEYDDVYGAPKPDEPYPHPAGDRGIAAVKTTAGLCRNGFLRGRIGDLPVGGEGTLTGVLGDAAVGPLVHVVRGAAWETVVPPASWSTEIVVLIVRGSAMIGERSYIAGELRVQQGDTAVGAIVAGPEGVELVFTVADRRATVDLRLSSEELAPAWLTAAGDLLATLEPRKGAVRAAKRRAASE